MRWLWIDRFVEFVSGQHASAIKNISIVEEQLDNYLPAYPVMPSSLIVEGIAQTGGLLVAEHNSFKERVVLAKVGKATFHRPAVPGDTLLYRTTIEAMDHDGAIVNATSQIGDTLQAEVELIFAHLDDRFEGDDLFHPADFLAMLRAFGLYDVATNADGQPLSVPQHLLDAELLAVTSGVD